jgi:hypothetical protein
MEPDEVGESAITHDPQKARLHSRQHALPQAVGPSKSQDPGDWQDGEIFGFLDRYLIPGPRRATPVNKSCPGIRTLRRPPILVFEQVKCSEE